MLDVLFLIPLPWWGSALFPVCIAALMVVGGTMITQFGRGVTRREAVESKSRTFIRRTACDERFRH